LCLGFTIPFTPVRDDEKSHSHILGHNLHKPVGLFIMPVSALCNTSIVTGAACSPGIGFTMSLFITNLAYKPDGGLINGSIMAVLIASVVSGILGYLWLTFCGKKEAVAE